MSEKRQRLAALLIATSLSTSSCLATVAVQADELQFGAPTLAVPAESFGVIDDASDRDAIEPRVAGSAVVVRENSDPSRSHLQFREQNGPWNSQSGPIGSAIQLLPPQLAPSSPVEAPVFLGNADAHGTEQIVQTPRMVTREDARLNGVRKTWEPKGPLFTQTEPSMILRGPESAEAELERPTREQLADNVPDSFDPTKMPSEFDSRPTRSVSDRNADATWDGQPNPNATQWNARRNVSQVSPLRDPVPSTTMAPIGSGALPQRTVPAIQPPALPPANAESLPSLPALNAPSFLGSEMDEDVSDLPQKVDELTSKIEELTQQLQALKSSQPELVEPTVVPAEPAQEAPANVIPPSIPKTRSAIDSLPEMKPTEPHKELPSLKDAGTTTTRETIGSGLQSKELSLETPPSLTPPKSALKPKSLESKLESVEKEKDDTERRLNESIAEQLRREEARDRSQIKEREDRMSLESASPRRVNERQEGIFDEKDSDELSRVPLQAVERDRLMPLEDAPAGSVSLRDIRGNDLGEADLEDLYAGELDRDDEPLDASAQQRLSLAQLDATGRPKTHSGKGAAANLSTGVMRMQQPIVQCLQHYYGRREQADGRSNWGMMHAVMVFGPDTRLIARGRDYSTIAWMAGNNVCRGQRLMEIEGGKIKAREGVGLQGHQAQWLAVLAMVGVPSDYPLYVDGQKFSVADLVKSEAAACEEGQELTFSLIGLSHYLDTETTWVGADGERWDFSRLIAAELDQPVVGSACGGTHRLMGFAHALRKRRLEGQPIDGQWARAEQFLDDFVDYTLRLQNRDGSMSTDWFESRQDNGDLDRKVQTTGHMVEFLLTHLPDEKLLEPEVLRSVTFLLNSMLKGRNNDWSIGPKGHALRSLALFHQRVYGEPAPLANPRSVARQRQPNRRSR
ncbi:GTPase-activating protein [Rhodopirellula sp. P2]|uniref:GTPase-activating protein n=1 Tax=Rhodopirellula sp. P2 TaxID=2127060 RepID=UPI0023689004|nr:GTPase-activating protein [Rhodopirellula sp. P2]WDQ15611.1 GTPase-activating protein [Rhodopirellula sp. P2]